MTLPYGLFNDRVFGGRQAVTTNPFDWRSRSKLPAPIVTTAKRPSWQDIKSGRVDAARAAVGAPAAPSPQAVADEMRNNFRTAYAKSPITQRLTKAAAQADLAGAGALSALDPQLTTQGVTETAQRYIDLTGQPLTAMETLAPTLLGGFAGNAAAIMSGSRLVTAGLETAGRAFGSKALASAGSRLAAMRSGPSLAGRLFGELAPVAPINIAQGLTDEEGGELTAMAGEVTGTERGRKLAERIRSSSPTTRRLYGVLENQGLDILGAGAMEAGGAALRAAGRAATIARQDIIRPMTQTDEAVAVSRRLGEIAQGITARVGGKAAVRGAGTDLLAGAVGAGAGAATGDDDQTVRNALAGAVMGVLGARAVRGAAAPGLSTNLVDDAGRPTVVDLRQPGQDRVAVPKRSRITAEEAQQLAEVDAPFPAYSQVLKTVAQSKQDKGGLDHWRGILTSPKSGIRAAELEQTGVLEWIASQKEPRMVGGREVMVQRSVTKQEVMDYHRSKLPELGAADRGVEVNDPETRRLLEEATAKRDTLTAEYEQLKQQRREASRAYQAAKDAQDWAEATRQADVVQRINADVEPLQANRAKAEAEVQSYTQALARQKQPAKWSDYAITSRLPKDDAELVTTFDPQGDVRYRNPTHWPGVDNPLAHTRLRRAEIDGERALILSESQSDLQQAARKQGRRSPQMDRDLADAQRAYDEYTLREPSEEEIAEQIRVARDPDDIGPVDNMLANDPDGRLLLDRELVADPRWERVQEAGRELNQLETALEAARTRLRDLRRDERMETDNGQYTPEGAAVLREIFDAQNRMEALRFERNSLRMSVQEDAKLSLIERIQRGEIDPPRAWAERRAARLRSNSDQARDLEYQVVVAETRLRSAMPAAPFPKTEDWTRLNIRRALALAAEENRGLLVLPTGEQVAGMFSLSRQVDELRYVGGELQGYRNGARVYEAEVPRSRLGEYVGEKVGKQLAAKGTLTGDEIKGAEQLGAQDMKAYYETFYQRELKSVLKELGQDATIAPLGRDIGADSDVIQRFVRDYGGNIEAAVTNGVRRVEELMAPTRAAIEAQPAQDVRALLKDADEYVDEAVDSFEGDLSDLADEIRDRSGRDIQYVSQSIRELQRIAKDMDNRIRQYRTLKTDNLYIDLLRDRKWDITQRMRDLVNELVESLRDEFPGSMQRGVSVGLKDNPAVRLKPETLAAIRAGQPLYAFAPLAFTSDENDQSRLPLFTALAAGAIVGNARGRKLLESTLASMRGTISQEAQSYGRYGYMTLPEGVRPSAEQLRQLNADITAALTGENGEDLVGQLVARRLGGAGRATAVTPATGVWEGSFTPNRLIEVEGGDDATRLRAVIHGLVEGQDAVAWHRYLGGQKGEPWQFGMVISGPNNAPLDTADVQRLLALGTDPNYVGFLSGATEQGGHILLRNFDGVDPKVFSAKIQQALQQTGIAADAGTGYFAGELISGTGAYLRAIGRDPDTLREARALVSRVQPVYEAFARQVGADPAVVTRRIEARLRGLDALEGRILNPPPRGGDGKVVVPQAAAAVAAETRAKYGAVVSESLPPKEMADAIEGRLRVEVQQLADDLGLTREEIEDWYAGGSRLLRDQLTLALPSLEDDDMWTIFTAASSALSSGQKVNDEIRSAANIWAQLERTLAGETPSWKGLSILDPDGRPIGKKKAQPAKFVRKGSDRGFIGQRGLGMGLPEGGYEPIALSQRTLNHEAFLADLRSAIEANGVQAVAKQLREGQFFVKGGKRTNPKTKVTTVVEDRWVPVPLAAIGPKTGQYFLDKLGRGGSGSTIDLWMARLYHVLRGEVPTRVVTEDDVIKARQRVGLAKELDLDDDEVAELKALIKGGAGKSTIDDTVTPQMRQVMQEVLRGIAGDFNATPSSAQALAWYVAKRMFARAGAKEDPNAYATLASGAADFLSTARIPSVPKGATSLDDPISMGASDGRVRGWTPAGERAKTFTKVGLDVPPQSAAALVPAFAVGDEPTEEEMKKAGVATGVLAGLAVVTGRGRAVLRRLPGVLAGQRRALLVSSSPAAAEVLKTIATGNRRLPKAQGFLNTAERIYAALVDEVYSVRKLGRTAAGEAPLTGLDAQLRQSERWVTWSAQQLRERLAPVLTAAKGREGDVMALVKAERDLQLRGQGAADKSDLDIATLQQAVADLSQDPATVAAARQLQDYYRELLDLRRREGLINDDQYNAIVASEDYYTPFVREWEREGVQFAGSAPGPAPGGKTYNSSTGVRKMNREQQARALTVDPFEMAVMDTQQTWRQVGRQRVWNMVSHIVEANGGEIPGLIRRAKSRDDVKAINRTIEAIVNGRRVTYEVMDTDLLKGLQSFSPQTDVPRFLKAVKEFKRAAITTFPDFAIRNLLRDNAQVTVGNPSDWRRVAMATGAGSVLGGASTLTGDEEVDLAQLATRAVIGAGLGAGASTLGPQLFRTMRGVTDIMAGSGNPLLASLGRGARGNAQMWQQFLRDGGASIGHYARDLESARTVLTQLRGQSVAKRILSPRSWWETLEAFGSTLENAPRLATYKQALGTGAGRGEAAARAADISLDFSRKGGAQTQKFLSGTTAFYNARVQGWDKLGRMVKDPKTWGVGFAALTAPSIANWLAIHESPDSREAYYEHPSWVRNTFWLVPTGGKDFVYIPKPFELGTIFSSIPERALDWWYTTQYRGDVLPGESAASSAKELASSIIAAELPLTDIAKPIVEQSLNYDMFRNRPIVSGEGFASSRKLPPEQVNDRTSKVARALGERFNLSPERIDHLVSAYGGTAGRMATRAIDPLLPGEQPTDIRASRVPVLGDLVAGFTDRRGTMSDDEVTLGRRWAELQRTDNSLRTLNKVLEDAKASDVQKQQAAQRIAEIRREQAGLIGKDGQHLDGVKQATEFLGDLRDRARNIARDTRITQDERRRQMEFLQTVRARAARMAVAGQYDALASLQAALESGS